MLKQHFCYRRGKDERNIDIPSWFQEITDASGRTLSGQTEGVLVSVSHIPLLSVGFNCALGADLLKPYLQLSQNTSFNVSSQCRIAKRFWRI
jgi:5-methyltetrahydrofolate--homocysteine methyltransferase